MPPQAQSRPSSLFESFTHAAAKMEAGWSFPDEWQTYVPNWTVWPPEKPLWRTDDANALTEHAAMARQPATSRCIWRLRSDILQGIGGVNKAQYRDEYRYPGRLSRRGTQAALRLAVRRLHSQGLHQHRQRAGPTFGAAEGCRHHCADPGANPNHPAADRETPSTEADRPDREDRQSCGCHGLHRAGHCSC